MSANVIDLVKYEIFGALTLYTFKYIQMFCGNSYYQRSSKPLNFFEVCIFHNVAKFV